MIVGQTKIQILEAGRGHEPILRNLTKLYLRDFGETDGGDAGRIGRFDDHDLDPPWERPVAVPIRDPRPDASAAGDRR